MLKKAGDEKFVDVDLSRHLVPSNSEVLIHAGSGGGWGNPLDREPERVQWDVIEGLVSREAAERDYAVVVSAGGALDAAASASAKATTANVITTRRWARAHSSMGA